jgi:hypothetical protein
MENAAISGEFLSSEKEIGIFRKRKEDTCYQQFYLPYLYNLR